MLILIIIIVIIIFLSRRGSSEREFTDDEIAQKFEQSVRKNKKL